MNGTVEEIAGNEKSGKCHTIKKIAVYLLIFFFI